MYVCQTQLLFTLLSNQGMQSPGYNSNQLTANIPIILVMKKYYSQG